ncbi:hypothetical protein HPP92_024056 [Vanilla planifolia]|uniref:Uncharacterized protein n=1 Tax=Vanilla planifolia TaxID=51239 RepID=A0A835U9K3_VANPL|nr:hypothetical protein HPP92_024056 [Vanilla planifolia]
MPEVAHLPPPRSTAAGHLSGHPSRHHYVWRHHRLTEHLLLLLLPPLNPRRPPRYVDWRGGAALHLYEVEDWRATAGGGGGIAVVVLEGVGPQHVGFLEVFRHVYDRDGEWRGCIYIYVRDS